MTAARIGSAGGAAVTADDDGLPNRHSPASPFPVAELTALELGMGWFPETPGGLNRMFFNLARFLPEAGVQVCGLVAGSERAALDSEGRVRAFAPSSAALASRLWRARRMALAEIDARSFDLIASHFALYTFPLLDRIRRQPFVVHFHGPWGQEVAVERKTSGASPIKRTIERAVYRAAGRVIVLSEAFGAVLARYGGVPEDRIRIVPGGVDAAWFSNQPARPEARARLGWPNDRPVVLAVRRLARRMGLENLIAAMATVRAAVPEALLMIVGQGPLAEDLAARIAASGLEDSVRLLGRFPDDRLALAYRAADLTVVPTTALEGFGLITIESLAAGTPVLVTPVGGLPEVVRDLSTDLILPSASRDALAEGIVAALTGTTRLPDARRCQAYARTRFDWPVIAELTRNVYREVIG